MKALRTVLRGEEDSNVFALPDNLGFKPERFGRFDLYPGWSNPVGASWVYE